jgi:hypothetical protein
MMQSWASAAKLRGGGSILHSGLEAMVGGRVTATSDRHRQTLAGTAKVIFLFVPFPVLSLMTPDVRRRPAASRPSSRDARGR